MNPTSLLQEYHVILHSRIWLRRDIQPLLPDMVLEYSNINKDSIQDYKMLLIVF